MSDFFKTGLPDVPRVKDAYDFARKHGTLKRMSQLRQREESTSDVAIATALILSNEMGIRDFDMIGAHLAGFTLPLDVSFYGNPQKKDLHYMTRYGLTASVGNLALRVQDFRYDNKHFPRLDVRVTSSAPQIVQLSVLAGAIYFLESLDARYGKMRQGAKEKQQGPAAITEKYVADIIRETLETHGFHKNIAFLDSVKEKGLVARYKKAMSRAENLILVTKPAELTPAQIKLRDDFNAEMAGYSKALEESYYNGPYTKYYGALMGKMSAMARKPNF